MNAAGRLVIAAGLFALASLGACGDEARPPPIGAAEPDASGSGGRDDGGLNLGDSGLGTGGFGGVLTEEPPCDASRPDLDLDLDGFSENQGDCNDCTNLMSPSGFDFPGNDIDEDCNGVADDEAVNCDVEPLSIDDPDPLVGARAAGLCKVQAGDSWGVVSARYVLADGSSGMNDISHGVLRRFGSIVTPRAGLHMLALSSGTARGPGDIGWGPPAGFETGTSGPTPPGFPVPAPSCPNLPRQLPPIANDSAGLEIVVRAPSNANAMRFDFTFYTFEFPDFICSPFNDFFVALVFPEREESQFGNVSFDNQGNSVSVNNSFLEVCEAQLVSGRQYDCLAGPGELAGTGFGDIADLHAATGWLRTEAPVDPGEELTIRFAIWDAGDHILDSLVLIDNFTWDITEAPKPVTGPIPR